MLSSYIIVRLLLIAKIIALTSTHKPRPKYIFLFNKSTDLKNVSIVHAIRCTNLSVHLPCTKYIF